MQKLIVVGILLVDALQCLISLQEGVAGEYVDGLGVVDLQFLLDDHDELEDREGLEDEDSGYMHQYLLLSNCFSFELRFLFSRIGILSGWNLRIISASLRLSYSPSYCIV